MGYNLDILWQTICMIVNPNMVDGFASLFNCTTVGRSSDKMMAVSPIYFRWSAFDSMSLVGLIGVMFVLFSCSGFRSPFEPLALFQNSVYDCICFTVMFHR